MKSALLVMSVMLFSLSAFAMPEIVCEKNVYIEGSENREKGNINKRLKELVGTKITVTNLSTSMIQTRSGHIESRCVTIEFKD